MMLYVIVSGVDARVIVQTSMSDHRQQSPRKLRRFKLDYIRPTSIHNNDDDHKGDVDVTLSWLAMIKERQLTSAPLSSSPAPSAADEDIVPDISRLDFFSRFPARNRPFRGSRTRSLTLNLPVWRLTDGDVGRSRVTGLLPRSVVSVSAHHPTSSREWRIAVLVVVVICFAVGLLLTVFAVWMRRRRRVLRTTPKL